MGLFLYVMAAGWLTWSTWRDEWVAAPLPADARGLDDQRLRARWLYAAVEIGAYVAIVAGVAFGVLTPWALVGLGAAVFAAKAITTALKEYDSFEGLVPAQGANVMAVLATNVLLAVGYVIAALLA